MNGRTGRLVKRFSLGFLAATVMLVAAPSGASGATTTIGQLAPTPEASCSNAIPFDHVQVSVTSGASYTVPADGTITSWSHNALAGTDHELKFKIFRKLAGADEYQVVAHDGEQPLTEGALNTFSVSIAVRAGDIIGINDGEDNTACVFDVPGESGERLALMGDLADGESGTFPPAGTFRLNLSAVLTTPNPLTATCKGRPATIIGTAGDNLLTGTNGADVIAALDGNDKVLALDGDDIVCGNDGKDRLLGQDGEDVLKGNRGNDTEKGGDGDDRLKGNRGADLLKGKSGEDFLGGGKGDDTCRGGGGDDKQKSC